MVRIRYSFSSRRTGHIENIRKQRKKFPEVVLEVVRISDVILEVLDARFVEQTRNLELDELILNQGKKIIYVINKIDLLEENVLEEKLSKINLKPYVLVSCVKRKGVKKLRDMIKIIVKKIERSDNKIRAQVGVIGYPNTGKSSLIDILTGRTKAKVGDEPGVTKGIQKIRLTKNILILDTPGVIPTSDYSSDDVNKIAKHTMVGSRSYSNVKDPEIVVQKLLDVSEIKDKIEKFYNINTEGNAEILLEEIGRKKGFLKKGGEVDLDRAARYVLKDYQQGKIFKSESGLIV